MRTRARTRSSLSAAWAVALVAISACAAVLPPCASGQTPAPAVEEWGDLGYVSVNAVLGGLTAGITSAVRGGPFFEPFAHGVLGGATSYVGKRVSGGGFWGAGLVGRQVAATGASMVRSAAFGDGLLDTLFLPLGPGRLHVPIGSDGRTGYRLDLEEVGWVVYSLTREHLSFDAGRTLSAGAFVFVGDERLRGEHDDALGRAAPGVISIRDSGPVPQATLAHEQAHIAQLDHLKIVWGLPLEGVLRKAVGLRTGTWLAHVEAGLGHYPILWLLTAPWSEHGSRPLEREAEYMESIRREAICPGTPTPECGGLPEPVR